MLGNISNIPAIRQNIHNRRLRIINLLYSSKSSLSSSEKNNRAKQIHTQNIKNNNKSYLKLKKVALSHTCCISKASIINSIVVTKKIQKYSKINFHFIFLNISFRVTFSQCSLFFISFIHVLI